MTLSDDNVELFFKLMNQLQLYVNRQVSVFPDCGTVEDLNNLEITDRVRLRDEVYANPELIDHFVEENPAGLDSQELSIISDWRKFIAGDFFIERYLAKHAIFIKDSTVYAVLALYDSFDSFAPKGYLPTLVKAVLLPFKGRIIYDGMMSAYPMHFGSGIRGNLRETYLKARQKGNIIETLDQASQTAASKKKDKVRDWRPEIDALYDQAQRLKAGKETPATQGAIFNLVKAAADLAKTSTDNPGDLDGLWDKSRKVHLKLQNVIKALDRED